MVGKPADLMRESRRSGVHECTMGELHLKLLKKEALADSPQVTTEEGGNSEDGNIIR